MTARNAIRGTAAARVQGQHRYGVVFAVILVLALFEITAPAGNWSHAIDVALAGAGLTVAVATSRAAHRLRRARALVVSGAALIVVIGIAAGVFGARVTYAVVTVLVALIPVILAGGILRLIRQVGVTVEVVAGALAMYLLVGLLFASIVEFAVHVQRGFFTQANVGSGDVVYYSFTVLTTTGFGDYTAAQPFGHALAVLEMLTGQLYLVTVIGVVVGSFTGRRMVRDGNREPPQRDPEAT